MSRRAERSVLIVLLALAFFLRVADLGRNSLWYDELLQLRVAAGSLQALLAGLEISAAMPLDYLITRAVLLVGSSEFLIRFPAAAFSTLAVAALYATARRLFSSSAAQLAAALFSVSGFAVLYAHEARPYALYLFLTLGSFYWLYRALQTGRLAHWLAYGFFALAAVLTHLFALFVLTAQVLFLIAGLGARVLAPRRALLFSRIRPWMIAGALALALLAIAALAFVPNLQYVPGSAQRFLAFLLNPTLPNPEDWSGVAPGETPPLLTLDFFYHRILDPLSGGGLFATASLLALGLAGLAAVRRRPWETLLVLTWAVIPSALIVLFLVHRATLFAVRYLIAALPAWLILCALGVLALGSILARLMPRALLFRRAAIAVLALVCFLVSLDRAAAAIALPKEDWRAAGQLLDLNAHAGDAVLAPGGAYLVYHYAPRAEPLHVPAETEPQIAAVEQTASRVWLLLSRYVYDPGGTIEAWLEARGAIEIPLDDDLRVYYWRRDADHSALLADAARFELPPGARAAMSLADLSAPTDMETARRLYNAALDRAHSPLELAHVHLARAHAERRAGNPAAALRSYHAALDSLANQGFGGALALDTALPLVATPETRTARVDAWVGLGRVYLDTGQLPAARDALTRALALDPDSYPALIFLAAYYDRAGRAGDARATYARAAEIVPELTLPP